MVFGYINKNNAKMNMISAAIDIYDGNAWQELASELCILKYTVEYYQKVPDMHQGDWGIEGYTLHGLGFQCYAPKKQHPVDHQVRLQKNKINDDLNKFVNNEKYLSPLVNGGKFRRWFFLTTVYESKELPAYCAKKTKEIRERCNHVTDDFAVMVHDADSFFLEQIPTYFNLGKRKITVPVQEVETAQIEVHQMENPSHLQKITAKLTNANVNPDNIQSLAVDYIKDLIAWNTIRENLKKTAPDLSLLIEKRVSSLEKDIIKKYQLNSELGSDELSKELSNLRQSLIAEVETVVDTTTIDFLSRGIIADWLTRCPIHF